MICDHCKEPILDADEYYEMPGDNNIHSDCLMEWAEQFWTVKPPEKWGIKP